MEREPAIDRGREVHTGGGAVVDAPELAAACRGCLHDAEAPCEERGPIRTWDARERGHAPKRISLKVCAHSSATSASMARDAEARWARRARLRRWRREAPRAATTRRGPGAAGRASWATKMNTFKLAAVLLVILVWLHEFVSCRVVFLVGNHSAERIASSGTSSADDLAALSYEFWQVSARLSIEPRLVWVPSKLNRAYAPSRGLWISTPARGVSHCGRVLVAKHRPLPCDARSACMGGRDVGRRLASEYGCIRPSPAPLVPDADKRSYICQSTSLVCSCA